MKLHVMLASQATSIILRCSSESSCHFLRLTRNSPTEDSLEPVGDSGLSTMKPPPFERRLRQRGR